MADERRPTDGLPADSEQTHALWLYQCETLVWLTDAENLKPLTY